MATDEVIELGLPWTPDPGVPAPFLWQARGDAVLVYRAAYSTGRAGGLAVLRFGGCLITTFGYPNDEALPGHPLYGRGLRCHDIFEVLNSTWLDRLRAQNLIRFPEASWWPGPSPQVEKFWASRPTEVDRPLTKRHFVITFHDDTFECIAATIDGGFTSRPFEEIFAELLRTATD